MMEMLCVRHLLAIGAIDAGKGRVLSPDTGGVVLKFSRGAQAVFD